MKAPVQIPVGSSQDLSVDQEHHGMRLDVFITSHFPGYTRSYFKKLIEQEHVRLNGHAIVKQGICLKVNDLVQIYFPCEEKKTYNPIQEPLNVSIVYEHEHFLIINKPAGLTVHKPHSKSTEVCLVDWLLAHYQTIATVGYNDRPGIVHRLDKNTSGLMIIARTAYAHAYFTEQFRKRNIKKSYAALVHGHPNPQGTITLGIGRHPIEKHKMVHVPLDTDALSGYITVPSYGKVRPALSDYVVREYLPTTSFVDVQPTTGRTHQIRVHMHGIGHPLIGDFVYGQKSPFITRHALHAQELAFEFEEKKYQFFAEPPHDFLHLLNILRTFRN